MSAPQPTLHQQYQPYAQWVQPVKLLPSGRPELAQNEVELCTSLKTNFYDSNQRIITDQLAILTSQRVILLPTDHTQAVSFPLVNHYRITSVAPWFKTPKITFYLRDNSKDTSFTTTEQIDASFYPTTITPTHPRETLTIGVKDSKIFHAFLQHIDQAKLSLIREWKAVVQQKQQERTANYGNDEQRAKNVGVAGILQQRKERVKQQETQLSEAGADLDSLMQHAQQVTVILEKLSQRAIAQQKREEEKKKKLEQGIDAASPSPEDQMSQAEQEDLTNVLEQMGYISPVTKQSSGNRFHEELSRQLFDFAQRPVQISHGNIGLVDLYCLYNRARGTELVSPQDVLKACQLWETLFPANPGNNQNSNRVSLRLKQLKSGAYIVQSSRYNENSERMRMQQYIFSRNCGLSGKGAFPIESDVPDLWRSSQSKGVSALEISQIFKISIQMANEHLEVLEKNDKIVRDNGPAAVLYYHNFFDVTFLEF